MSIWTGTVLIPGTAEVIKFPIPGSVILPNDLPSRRDVASAAAAAVWPSFDRMLPDRPCAITIERDGEHHLAPGRMVTLTRIDSALVGSGGVIPYIFRRPPP